ncbi:hypothetical protein FFLO_02756 [Filobasidium floriforme]|uniref:Nuclear proteasome inhibitor UBLCP1 n=1 Tax=Filobasidium floriforme TaxID=5210 RepID=A0A8K0NTQ9_9TREE|nr:hypothetical protein FFLO_02756 [Filobasidium floriforme]
MSSQHDESPPDDLIRASPDLEAQTLPTEIEGLKPLAGSLSTQSVGETIEDEAFVLNFTWAGKPFQLELRGTDRVYDLKSAVQSETAVPPERQKYIGLVKGKLPGDECLVSQLGVPLKSKFVLVGTPEDKTFKDPHELNLSQFPDTSDNFDVAYGNGETAVAPADDPRNIRLITQKISECPINLINPPRPGKKLLVLDLDYTLVDSKPLLAGSLPPLECVRPTLHEFLEKAYEDYDIVIWSQTNYWWLESKLYECGIIGDETKRHKLLCVCDRKSMFPIFGQKNGQKYKHEVKPLSFLWQQPEFQGQW